MRTVKMCQTDDLLYYNVAYFYTLTENFKMRHCIEHPYAYKVYMLH